MDYDAEGIEGEERCPECDSLDTVTYTFTEGFTELECRNCGYTSESDDIADLTRYSGRLKEGERLPPIPIKKIKA